MAPSRAEISAGILPPDRPFPAIGLAKRSRVALRSCHCPIILLFYGGLSVGAAHIFRPCWRQVATTVSIRSTNRLPAALSEPPLIRRQISACRSARSAALFVGRKRGRDGTLRCAVLREVDSMTGEVIRFSW